MGVRWWVAIYALRSPGISLFWQVAVALLLTLSAGFIYTWPRVQTFKLGYAISQFERRRMALLDAQGTLQIELESLRALRRISRISREQLGLRLPDPRQVVILEYAPPPPVEVASRGTRSLKSQQPKGR